MTVALAQTPATGSEHGSTSVTATLGGNTTSGNCLVACIQAFTSSGSGPVVTGITLGGSADNWAQIASVSPTSFTNDYIWIDPGCAGGQSSIVITISSTTGPAIQAYVYEFSGIASASTLDQSSTGSGASSPWSSGATSVTSQAAEAWVGFVASHGAGAATITGPSGSWTNLSQLSTTEVSHLQCLSGYQIPSGTGTATYNGSFSSSTTEWGALVVTLKGGSSTPASGSVLLTYF